MAVKTRVISLDRQWQQLADGSSNIFIQVKSGVLEYAVADSRPVEDTEGHTMGGGKELIVTVPTSLWGRACYGSPSTRVVVSPQD